MFNKADANRLRQNLGSIEFLQGSAESAFELGADAMRDYRVYAKHYGLNFGELDTGLSGIRSSIGTFRSESYDLVCQHFVPSGYPPKKTAFILHGYFDHAGLYRHLIRHLLQSGIAVVIFDLPGHGLSSGATASINSFREYSVAFGNCLTLAKEQSLPAPWFVIGQSTGGAIIMDSFLEQRLQGRPSLQHTILLCPLVKPRHWSRSKVLFSLSKRFVASTPRKFSKNSHDEEFLQFLESEDELQSRILPRDWVQAMIDFINRFDAAPGCQQPLQIIQGRGDGTVEWEKNIPAILKKFAGSQVHWIEEAGHHLVNESTPYRGRVFAIIDQILESEPTEP